jgi:ABC-type antimicrobial peptide transport system permease subunit
MSVFRYILRSLFWFRRQHLALFAGTLVATAVLTGALIIGDSVRFSLQNIAKTRLGSIRFSITTGGRFIRSELADEMSAVLDAPSAAVLMLQGIAINQETRNRLNRVQVVGIDSCFWNFGTLMQPAPGPGEAILSENTATQLGLKPGDAFLLRVEQAGLIPVNAPFSPGNKPSVAFRLTIKAIANDKSLGRFSLRSNQLAPYTVFINRESLAEKLELSGFSNFVLIGENGKKDLTSEKISKTFGDIWKPLDAGLQVKNLPSSGKFDLVSNRVFIDKTISKEIEKLSIPHENILTYLVNSIRRESKSTPYSFVFAAPANVLPGMLNSGQIVINQWLADDLQIHPGDSLSLDYYTIGPLRKLDVKSRSLKVSAIIPTSHSLATPNSNSNFPIDSTLMPSFPGLSTAGNCRDWNTSVPIDLKRIRDKDERYWDDWKGTPKAVISQASGLEMWTNPFGEYTAVRFRNDDVRPDTLLGILLKNIHPEDLGIIVIPVFSEGLASAGNSVDFGQLFLGLSFFIIVAGLLLIVLIFSLNIASRSSEIALLSGLGIPQRQILRINFAESFIVVLLGSIFGSLAGILYNFTLIKALNTVWKGAVQTNMLEICINPATLTIGAGTGFILAFFTIILLTRSKLKKQIAGLLKSGPQYSEAIQKSFSRRSRNISLAGIGGSTLLVLYSVISGAFEDPALFLSAGALFLSGSIFGIAWILEKVQHTSDYSAFGIFRLALKNAGRSKRRSLTVVFLLAIGVYSIIITGSYRKTFTGAENDKNSGSGGYLFWAETSLPIPEDLNDPLIQNKYLIANNALSPEIHFEQFQSLEGDDASCLNLNLVSRPRILGIHPGSFEKREAFSFVSLLNKEAKLNPWAELGRNMGNDIIPAFADQTVIQYGLKKSIGDTLYYLDETGKQIKIVLVGGLDNSVFQGNLLIDAGLFSKHFPSSGGSRVMLIDTPLTQEKEFSKILSRSLADYGIEVSKASDRLASFNTVENTYLSVFMILGGLGLVIGTFGLAIVFFRNILERRHEFAVLSALGLKDRQIIRLIVTENSFLFLAGLVSGILAAVLSILPSLILPGFQTQVIPVLVILLLLLICGIFWIWILARNALRRNTIEILKNE